MQLNWLVIAIACAAEAVNAETLRPEVSHMGTISTTTMLRTSTATAPTDAATPEMTYGQSASGYKKKLDRRRALDRLLKKEDQVVTPGCGKTFVPQYYRRRCPNGIDCTQSSPEINDPPVAPDSMGYVRTLEQKVKPAVASKFEATSSTKSIPILIPPSPSAQKYPSFVHEL